MDVVFSFRSDDVRFFFVWLFSCAVLWRVKYDGIKWKNLLIICLKFLHFEIQTFALTREKYTRALVRDAVFPLAISHGEDAAFQIIEKWSTDNNISLRNEWRTLAIFHCSTFVWKRIDFLWNVCLFFSRFILMCLLRCFECLFRFALDRLEKFKIGK